MQSQLSYNMPTSDNRLADEAILVADLALLSTKIRELHALTCQMNRSTITGDLHGESLLAKDLERLKEITNWLQQVKLGPRRIR